MEPGLIRIADGLAVIGAAGQRHTLQRALDSRIVIEQAKGIVSGRHSVELEEAFERIRSHARSRGECVQEVSRRICAGDLDVFG